jgi:multicomponent Na+:H+ antiporter subunit A
MAETSASVSSSVRLAQIASLLWLGGLFVVFVAHAEGEILSLVWLSEPQVEFRFHLDAFRQVFTGLITAIGVCVFVFACRYLNGHPHFWRFFIILHLFTAAMLGVVLADDIITLFIAWELTSLTSYFLIGFKHEDAKSRRAALQGLLVTASGGLCLLAGLIVLGVEANTFRLSELVRADLTSMPYGTAGLVLVTLGCFTKSAQVPFHFWLPNAMQAPTPVSAFLHSATMVKAGVFLLAVLMPLYAQAPDFLAVFSIIGAVTAAFAGLKSVQQHDIKQVFAYTTLMALGTLVALLGIGSEKAVQGFVVFLVAHALYKAGLFLGAGAIESATGTRDLRQLRGLWWSHRTIAVAVLLNLLALAGLPPLAAFIGKELIYGALFASELNAFGWMVLGLVFVANASMVAVSIRVGRMLFLPTSTPDARIVPVDLWIGSLLLGIASLASGFWALWQSDLLLDSVAVIQAMAVNTDYIHLWAGVNAALIASVVTYAAGFVIIRGLHVVRDGQAMMYRLGFHADRGWDLFLSAGQSGFECLTRWISDGRVSRDFSTMVFFTVVLVGWIIAQDDSINTIQLDFALDGIVLMIGLLMVGGILLASLASSRIATIAGLGVVGIGTALLFIYYGAPDVAITQLLIETLAVVLLATALLHLPRLPVRRPVRKFHALLSILFGGIVTVILMRVSATPVDRAITDYYETASWTEAYGLNIVNVILVDFRALDTFGEITVVMIAAMAARVLFLGHGKASR